MTQVSAEVTETGVKHRTKEKIELTIKLCQLGQSEVCGSSAW